MRRAVALALLAACAAPDGGVALRDTGARATDLGPGGWTGWVAPAPGATSDSTAPPEVDCRPGWNVPPPALAGWAPVLSGVGPDTLTVDPAHGHDDGLGPIGWCPSEDPSGPHVRLVAARFETDQVPPDGRCAVDPFAPDPVHDAWGACTSGGNHHVYVEVRDASGARIPAAFDLWWDGGATRVEDQGKPPGEFPMNAALWGGGQYGVTPVVGDLPAERVTNLRLPLNHHVNYLLTFQVVEGPDA